MADRRVQLTGALAFVAVMAALYLWALPSELPPLQVDAETPELPTEAPPVLAETPAVRDEPVPATLTYEAFFDGVDVTGKTSVYLFNPGANPNRARAVGQGKGGVVRVWAGRYDLVAQLLSPDEYEPEELGFLHLTGVTVPGHYLLEFQPGRGGSGDRSE